MAWMEVDLMGKLRKDSKSDESLGNLTKGRQQEMGKWCCHAAIQSVFLTESCLLN